MQIRGRERVSTQVSSWLPRSRRPWDPTQLQLNSWHDAADTTTIISSGSPAKVSQWSDKSGNNIHITQSDNTLKPLTNSATINNLNVISCDSHLLTFSSWTVTTRFIAIALQATSAAGYNGAFWRHGNGIPQVILRHEGQNLNAIRYFSRSWDEDITLNNLPGLNSPHIIVAQTVDNVAISVRLNGSTIGAKGITGAQPTVTGDLYVCSFGGYEIFRGNIAEIITSATTQSGSQVQSVEQYLSNKWGIPISSGA